MILSSNPGRTKSTRPRKHTKKIITRLSKYELFKNAHLKKSVFGTHLFPKKMLYFTERELIVQKQKSPPLWCYFRNTTECGPNVFQLVAIIFVSGFNHSLCVERPLFSGISSPPCVSFLDEKALIPKSNICCSLSILIRARETSPMIRAGPNNFSNPQGLSVCHSKRCISIPK